ncbi:MAG: methyltransferase domain-containing protein [Azospirillum sp.]|nr:methyltransferase domain-containing protein [Azospirillum sp.]
MHPARTPGYFSFGYLPAGDLRSDIGGRLFGVPNLLKRLQAMDILRAMDVQPTDTVLDFGCGSGYITVELAKLARKAIGVDINNYIETVPIPAPLVGRLEYKQCSGVSLPFSDGSFDRILASEVLPMLPDPAAFLASMRRVLKPDGRLVVMNGLGFPFLRDAYARNAPRLQALARRYPGRFPATYDAYCAEFQKAAGTGRTNFMTEENVLDALSASGFHVQAKSYAPRRRAGEWIGWNQFELYLESGRVVPAVRFLPRFLFLSALNAMDSEPYLGGLIVVATNRQ